MELIKIHPTIDSLLTFDYNYSVHKQKHPSFCNAIIQLTSKIIAIKNLIQQDFQDSENNHLAFRQKVSPGLTSSPLQAATSKTPTPASPQRLSSLSHPHQISNSLSSNPPHLPKKDYDQKISIKSKSSCNHTNFSTSGTVGNSIAAAIYQNATVSSSAIQISPPKHHNFAAKDRCDSDVFASANNSPFSFSPPKIVDSQTNLSSHQILSAAAGIASSNKIIAVNNILPEHLAEERGERRNSRSSHTLDKLTTPKPHKRKRSKSRDIINKFIGKITSYRSDGNLLEPNDSSRSTEMSVSEEPGGLVSKTQSNQPSYQSTLHRQKILNSLNKPGIFINNGELLNLNEGGSTGYKQSRSNHIRSKSSELYSFNSSNQPTY